ncbi:regenerating islet-derived protein 4 [Kogia breviceps]|uniref:regenerating islet-derived protein 4 n=1 Tax=Kogia breviceps TaxID=27615 RepID=UPI0027960EB5|nr:regenerating islet-derived protein 4 [Kogia breviceps]
MHSYSAIILRPSCATGWFYYKSWCWGYFQKLRNWSDAELECQLYGNGAHLASILNLKEANTIAMYIGGYRRNKPVWICLHDLQKRQQWKWLDGATYIYRTMFGKSVGGNKYYAEMNAKNNFLTWNSKACSKLQHFLWKYRP